MGGKGTMCIIIKLIKRPPRFRIANSRRNNSLYFAQAGNSDASAKLVFTYSLTSDRSSCLQYRLLIIDIFRKRKTLYLCVHIVSFCRIVAIQKESRLCCGEIQIRVASYISLRFVALPVFCAIQNTIN